MPNRRARNPHFENALEALEAVLPPCENRLLGATENAIDDGRGRKLFRLKLASASTDNCDAGLAVDAIPQFEGS